MLTARDLSVNYGSKPVLRGVDLTAHPGQLTAIVGPNGSGKSTALKAVTGELPFIGDVRLSGMDVAHARPGDLASVRAVLPQFTPLAFPFTVLEVVRLGVSRGATFNCDQIVNEALHRVGLDGYQGRYFQELSGGEQQRVQLARVLVQVWQPVGDDGPRWLFLDEPVSSLDIGHQLQIMQVARTFADMGGGVIAVMHDLNLTAMFADKVVLFSNGGVVSQGTATEVFTDDMLMQAYGCRIAVSMAPSSGPFILPQTAALNI
ncbi:heme ABC transporter ATP-binding protein [Shimia sp. CNT1-13L.2]|uniref:heme ABC transporter ATP-binding protein n=1 Tax=Shimia sp. CNT1-13L.2 TaxID=2959663 RepID=UPI0020CCD62E|nr:heme ABC transporter ATP-binding protein [Shimia sp. CNT1-13L.2]MCP9484101.1 heme ABC transporter ATP-binding protein [Shimia sp. CNT1-13L.2]